MGEYLLFWDCCKSIVFLNQNPYGVRGLSVCAQKKLTGSGFPVRSL